MDIGKIISQAIEILTKPKEALPKLKEEQMTMQDIIIYLAIVGIPTFLGVFIGYGFVGYGFANLAGWGFAVAIIQYVLSIIGMIVFAFIFNALATNFKSKQDKMQSMKLIAATATPWLIAGIFSIYPAASLISLLGGLYGLYILYLGLPIFMETPQDQQMTYLIVGLVIYVIVMGVIWWITSFIWTSLVWSAVWGSTWGAYSNYYNNPYYP